MRGAPAVQGFILAFLMVAQAPSLPAPPDPREPTPPASPDTGRASAPQRGRVAVPEEDPNFLALLDRLAERAELYRKRALGFTCREVVIVADYDLDSADFKKSDKKLYDYLFEERPEGTLREVRERLEEEKDGVKRRSTDYEPPVPPAYAWATLFSQANRGRFHFRPSGQEVRAYRLLTRIEFIGIAPNPGGNDISGWSGTVALEARSLNLWSVEAAPSGQSVRLDVEILKYRRAFAIVGVPLASRPHGWQLDVTFGIEVAGLSYPTEQALSMTSLASGSQKMAVEEKTTFRYEDYRFFGVEVPPEELKETEPSAGDPPPSPPPG